MEFPSTWPTLGTHILAVLDLCACGTVTTSFSRSFPALLYVHVVSVATNPVTEEGRILISILESELCNNNYLLLHLTHSQFVANLPHDLISCSGKLDFVDR